MILKLTPELKAFLERQSKYDKIIADLNKAMRKMAIKDLTKRWASGAAK